MTPFASVAMLEKLALLKIALCRAPALRSASSASFRAVLSEASKRPASVLVSSFPLVMVLPPVTCAHPTQRINCALGGIASSPLASAAFGVPPLKGLLTWIVTPLGTLGTCHHVLDPNDNRAWIGLKRIKPSRTYLRLTGGASYTTSRRQFGRVCQRFGAHLATRRNPAKQAKAARQPQANISKRRMRVADCC